MNGNYTLGHLKRRSKQGRFFYASLKLKSFPDALKTQTPKESYNVIQLS